MTSADVAAAAGVSRATVSYVLNGVHDRISPETQARVFAAAERLGYVPNAMASALRAGRTEIVLLALPSWPLGQAVAEWVTAGVAELERMGYTPLVHFRHGDDRERLIRACDRVRPIAVIGPGDDLPPERVEALRANGTRAVMAISPTPLEHVVTLLVDQALDRRGRDGPPGRARAPARRRGDPGRAASSRSSEPIASAARRRRPRSTASSSSR